MEEIQNDLNALDTVGCVLPLTGGGNNEVVGQALALLAALLDGGNRQTQVGFTARILFRENIFTK